MAKKKKQIVVPKDTSGSYGLSTVQCCYGSTKRDVDKKVTAYFGKYHPMGYGTRFQEPIQESPDGYWFCVITRYNSCD